MRATPHNRPPSFLPIRLVLIFGALAALGGCVDSLPASELPTREQTVRPILDKDGQQKAIDALVKDRNDRSSAIIQSLEVRQAQR